MQSVIRINDKTTHGGTVIEGSSGVKFLGLEVACLMDKVTCPEHGQTFIAEGDEGLKINGKPVALHGHRCGCGCTLISSLPHAGKR
ncbi:TPA: PAAR domain-containing protein [Enterobacter chengduensis]|nr:PAAR domain-containing protein [Enterobacter chengduensis]